MANVKRKASEVVSTSVSPGAPEGRPDAWTVEPVHARLACRNELFMPDAPTDPDNLLSELLPPFWALFQPEPSEADRAVIGPDYLSYLDDETDGTAREYARRIGAGNAASYAVVLRAGARKAGPA